jgi:CubicO group peptidase (beta-lactamase class C family)
MELAGIDALLRKNCGHVFTGAVARVEHRGRLVFERTYGATRDDEFARPAYLNTRFDLASLTKLFVTTLVLKAVAERRLDLDEPLTSVLPEWNRSRHAAITTRMLLAHNSGIDSGADYRVLLNRNVEEFSLREPLVAAPRERVIYSDLGFIVLGVVLERVHGSALVELAARTFSRATLGFRPHADERADIPATEDDGWRGRVQGIVHDEKAYLMGGAAGHAGLFGTAADVAWLTQQYLTPLCHGEPFDCAAHAARSGQARSNHRLNLSLDLVREATREQAYDPVLRRGLGWALKTTDENSCGRFLSHASFGHTGFVGTCVWADPERDLLGVLLTNSVYFGRRDTRDFRAAFYEAMVKDIA